MNHLLPYLPRPSRLLALAVVLVYLVVQSGCAPARAPSPQLHDQLRHEVVALLPATLITELEAMPLVGGRGEGALKGAGEGFVGCLGSFNGSCSGEVCGAMLLVMLAFAVTCSAVGAVAGAVTSTPAAETRAMAAATDRAFAGLNAHLDLTRRMLAHIAQLDGVTVELVGREPERLATEEALFTDLAARGLTTALELGVTRIAFAGGKGRDPELALEMKAVARVLELPGGKERYRQEFVHRGPARRYSAWAYGDGTVMRRAVDDGLAALAAQMTQRLFEQVDLGIPSGTWTLPGSGRHGCCWLCPVAPPSDYSFWGKKLRYLRVDSLQPELAWEAFPTPDQAAALATQPDGVPQAVRYDLRIWEARGDRPGALVYERLGLPQPVHRLESPLKPQWRYLWSFRACFDSVRGARCTPWAWSLVPSAGATCESPAIPPTNYFRFGT